MSTVAPYQQINSFSSHPHFQQILSYIIFLVQTVFYYSLVLPNYSSTNSLIIFTSLFSFSLLLLMIITIICSKIDPSDRIMIEYRSSSSSRDNFEEKKKNDGENLLYCNQCVSFVREKSRHCRTCNRCTQNFDHHCKWINNCVGGLNYSYFFIMIVCASVNIAIYIISVVFLSFQQIQTFKAQFIIAAVFGVISAIFLLLLLNLVIFHIYINIKGITTFQFLVRREDGERLQRIKQWELEKQQEMKQKEDHTKHCSQEQSHKVIIQNNVGQIQANLHFQLNKIHQINSQQIFASGSLAKINQQINDKQQKIENVGMSKNNKKLNQNQIRVSTKDFTDEIDKQ